MSLRRSVAVLVLALAGALPSACRRAERPAAAASGPPASYAPASSRDAPALPPGERYDLLLVTLDTVRADVLRDLGAKQVVAPNLEQLASEGVLFRAAETVTPLTLPAHCSLLTGLHPGTHGVRHNARYALGAQHVTLATVLRGAGYDTGAFVAAFPLAPEYGTNQGFDTYDASFERAKGVDSDRPAPAVNAAALAWLKRPRDKPFFAWIHYFDAHDPYVPREPWKSRFPGSPYLAEVASVDAALGEVLAALQAAGRLERTLVVVAADHGEGLGEHGEPFHGLLLHGSTVRIPLVFRGGPLQRQARTIEFPVSIVDVMPTALALLGVPGPAAMQGLDLSSQLRGEGDPPERAGALSESWYGHLEFGWSPLRGLRDERHRYIESPSPELFDVRRDPRELSNLAAKEAELAASLRAALLQAESAVSSAGASGSAAQPMSAQEMEALQSLGYVASGGGIDVDASAIPEGPDPKAMIAVYEKYNAARARLDSGDPAGALALLDQIVPLDPKNLQFRGKRAKALAFLGRPAEAEAEWTSMIAQDPKYVHAYWDLALFHDLMGRTRRAVEVLREMARVDPSYVGLTERIATLLAATGETDEAIALLTAAPEPGHEAQAGERLALAGRFALRAGDAAAATSLFDRALQAEPRADVPAWLVSAARHEAEGRGAQALLALQAQAKAEARSAAAWSELCHAALRLDATDVAVSACATLVSLPGHEPQDQAAVLRSLLRAGRREEAEARSRSLLAGSPGWWWLHRARAEELERRGDPAAREAYEAWAALDPESKAAQAGLARRR
jgi:choline-sulfatase